MDPQALSLSQSHNRDMLKDYLSKFGGSPPNNDVAAASNLMEVSTIKKHDHRPTPVAAVDVERVTGSSLAATGGGIGGGAPATTADLISLCQLSNSSPLTLSALLQGLSSPAGGAVVGRSSTSASPLPVKHTPEQVNAMATTAGEQKTSKDEDGTSGRKLVFASPTSVYRTPPERHAQGRTGGDIPTTMKSRRLLSPSANDDNDNVGVVPSVVKKPSVVSSRSEPPARVSNMPGTDGEFELVQRAREEHVARYVKNILGNRHSNLENRIGGVDFDSILAPEEQREQLQNRQELIARAYSKKQKATNEDDVGVDFSPMSDAGGGPLHAPTTSLLHRERNSHSVARVVHCIRQGGRDEGNKKGDDDLKTVLKNRRDAREKLIGRMKKEVRHEVKEVLKRTSNEEGSGREPPLPSTQKHRSPGTQRRAQPQHQHLQSPMTNEGGGDVSSVASVYNWK